MQNITANTVIQGIIATACVIGTFLLVINQREIPTIVSALDGAVIAFYFTNAQAQVIARSVVAAVNGNTQG